MKSKNRRRVLFFVFSALIMVGLCIGVFADYDPNLNGYYSYVEPYNIGDTYLTMSNTTQIIESGYYYWHFHFNEIPDYETSILVSGQYDYRFVIYVYDDDRIVFHLSENGVDYDLSVNLDDSNDVYVYLYLDHDLNAKYSNVNSAGTYVTVDLCYINEEYSIDIYDNSQDVWASVVSVVTDATDSVINNDILLLFAAAVPVISFGVGFLIRLKFRG